MSKNVKVSSFAYFGTVFDILVYNVDLTPVFMLPAKLHELRPDVLWSQRNDFAIEFSIIGFNNIVELCVYSQFAKILLDSSLPIHQQ